MTDFDIEAALARFDEMNARDPRQAEFNGQTYPRELLHAKKVHEWLMKLAPDASGALRLAARGNALRRWEIPRDSFPMTTAGYHKWRKALRKLHAEAAEEALKDSGAPPDLIVRVRRLITMADFPADPESRILEDADCLTFLETKFHEYIPEWDEIKTIRILKGTISKMSAGAVELAAAIPMSSEARALLEKALQP